MPARRFGDNRDDTDAGAGGPASAHSEPSPGERRHRLRSRTLLVEYLDALGYSGRSFAREAGLGHATVNHLLTGRRGTCSRGTADRIEAALHCPPGLLFEGRRR